jgi:putative ABC transport system permease protein
MFENIRIAFVGLGSNKLRSGLTMLGITIGVAAVIILVSIGQAVEFFILGQFQSIGSNLVVVFGEDDDRGFFVPLTQSDADALSDPYRVPDALAVSPNYIIFAEAITHEDRESDSDLAGVTERYIEVVNRTIVAGRFIDENDVLTAARVAVVGQAVVDKLLPDVYPLEQIIEINNVSFRIIGVLNEAGSAAAFKQ